VRFSGPPFRIQGASLLIEFLAPGKDLLLTTAVALVWRHIADSAVPMLTVVPADETRHPALCEAEAGERRRG